MIPSPYDRHRPTRTRASARAMSSRARRDLPMPGGPTIVASCGVRVSTAVASARSSRSSSSSRPTNGAAIGRVNAGTSSSSSSTRKVGTGSRLPFSASGSIGSARTRSRTSRSVARADQDLARPGSLLQPRRDVHGVAGDERLAGAGDDLAGVHADADLEAEPGDGVAHLDRRPNGSQRVVLVDLGQPEDRHRRVADELLDRAAVALEDRAELGVVAAHELAQDLGIGPLAERRRADEVAEHDGHGLANPRCRLQPRAARRRRSRTGSSSGSPDRTISRSPPAKGAAKSPQMQDPPTPPRAGTPVRWIPILDGGRRISGRRARSGTT